MALFVLKRNLDTLARLLDPTPIATMLYSDSLIIQEAWDVARSQRSTYERNLKVLEALEKAILVDEFAFDRFLEHLKKEPVYVPYVQKLEAQLIQARSENHTKTVHIVAIAGPPVIRSGELNNATLMKIAREIGPKWVEVGISIGIDYTVLQNEVAKDTNIQGEHMKAFRMLLLCQSRCPDTFNYVTIAKALEDCGLTSCALQHCYHSSATQ